MSQEVYIFLGPPGAGKGSISRMCVKNLGWKQLSTGDLCRKYIAEGHPIGKEIDFAIKSGKLVSDELITQMVVDWLTNQTHDAPVIFDGFPRTLAQARAFEQVVKDMLPSLKLHIVQFDVDDSVLINRLTNRFVCTNKDCQAVYSRSNSSMMPKHNMTCDECEGKVGKRKDDEPQTVKERIQTYHQHAQPIIDFYDKHNRRIHHVTVDQPLPRVFDSFKEVIRGRA